MAKPTNRAGDSIASGSVISQGEPRKDEIQTAKHAIISVNQNTNVTKPFMVTSQEVTFTIANAK